jgi:hypothetical protein
VGFLLGYEKSEMSGHGFRTMARTLIDEKLQIRPDLNQPPRSKLSRYEINIIISQQATENQRSSRQSGIEHQLAYAVRNPLGHPGSANI